MYLLLWFWGPSLLFLLPFPVLTCLAVLQRCLQEEKNGKQPLLGEHGVRSPGSL